MVDSIGGLSQNNSWVLKVIFTFLFPAAILSLIACSPPPSNLIEGGVYVSHNDDGSFSVSKILVLEPDVVHIRLYANTFKTIPNDLNSAELEYAIGHTPLEKRNFLYWEPALFKVEEVSEEELEGYQYYMEAMSN